MCSWQSSRHVYAPRDLEGTEPTAQPIGRTQAGSWSVGKSPCLPSPMLCTCLFMTHQAAPLLGQVLQLLVQHLYSGGWCSLHGPREAPAREHGPARLTDLVVAVHQDNAQVGGLEPAPALHDYVVALADVVDVHRDAGICPCNAQQGPGVPRPARHSPPVTGPCFSARLVLIPASTVPGTPRAVHTPSCKREDSAPSARYFLPLDRGSESLNNCQGHSSFYLPLTYGVTSLASSVSILWHPPHSGASAPAP